MVSKLIWIVQHSAGVRQLVVLGGKILTFDVSIVLEYRENFFCFWNISTAFRDWEVGIWEGDYSAYHKVSHFSHFTIEVPLHSQCPRIFPIWSHPFPLHLFLVLFILQSYPVMYFLDFSKVDTGQRTQDFISIVSVSLSAPRWLMTVLILLEKAERSLPYYYDS